MKARKVELKEGLVLRRLTPEDLERAILIDKQVSGRARKGYFQSRLKAALRNQDAFVQIGIDEEGKLVGYMLARQLSGEYGRTTKAMTIEVINVDPKSRNRGLGQHLMSALEAEMKDRGITDLQTEVNWTNHKLLAFLDHSGFEIAPRMVLQRPVSQDIRQPREAV